MYKSILNKILERFGIILFRVIGWGLWGTGCRVRVAGWGVYAGVVKLLTKYFILTFNHFHITPFTLHSSRFTHE
jgi:hypothetical protein